MITGQPAALYGLQELLRLAPGHERGAQVDLVWIAALKLLDGSIVEAQNVLHILPGKLWQGSKARIQCLSLGAQGFLHIWVLPYFHRLPPFPIGIALLDIFYHAVPLLTEWVCLNFFRGSFVRRSIALAKLSHGSGD